MKKCFILILITGVVVFNSCIKKCNGYQVEERTNLTIHNFNNSGSSLEDNYADNDTIVPAKAYLIGAIFATKIIENHVTNVECYQIKYNNNITALTIFSLQNFDSSHLANTSLNDYFKIRYSELNNAEHISIEKLINTTEFALLLFAEPKLDSVFRFVVKVDLSDGSYLSDTTKTIKLTK
jgi:hypothetical protein